MFYSALDNLALEELSYKDLVSQLIARKNINIVQKKSYQPPLQSFYNMGQKTWDNQLKRFKKK